MLSENNSKGELACLKFEMRALQKGCIISKPNVEARYDRIVDDHGKLYRVQIKYSNSKPSKSTGATLVHLEKNNHGKYSRYTSNEIDAVVIYVAEMDYICWMPIEIVDGKTTITLRYNLPKNNQTKGILFTEDFIW